jgi:hypothetical protein
MRAAAPAIPVTIILLAMACAGCAGAPLSSAEKALKRTSELVSLWSEVTEAPLRYNPARCDCPEFEIRLGDRWHRIVIANDVKEDPLAAEVYRNAVQVGPGWRATVSGKIDGVVRKRYRSPVMRLKINQVCGPVGCSDDQQAAPGAEVPPDAPERVPSGPQVQ